MPLLAPNHLPVLIAAALLSGVAGCTQVPELNDTVTDDLSSSKYPALVPLAPTLGTRPAPQDEAERLESSLNGRRDRLKSRASGLQAGIIDEKTRKRMREGVAR
ncbi:hypothetical protein LCL97_02160 [Seohaeicola saemankumensis]|nr:hypothetical protein [Seohaeicola saemankumensis]MCA0869619.1 hypothetical protein [Seohaeicola saemankumensis]